MIIENDEQLWTKMLQVESKPVDKKKETVQIPSQSIDDFDARKEDMLSKLGGSSKKTSGGSGWGWGGMLSGIGSFIHIYHTICPLEICLLNLLNYPVFNYQCLMK